MIFSSLSSKIKKQIPTVFENNIQFHDWSLIVFFLKRSNLYVLTSIHA
jgi:hypothetical protein